MTHLELSRDKDGDIKRDDLGRPVLAIRLHDRQFGWFDVVARRWGEDSFEAEQAKEMVRDWEFAQLYLPGLEPDEIGSVKKADFNESIAADQRNGDTTPLTERANVFTADGRRITPNGNDRRSETLVWKESEVGE